MSQGKDPNALLCCILALYENHCTFGKDPFARHGILEVEPNHPVCILQSVPPVCGRAQHTKEEEAMPLSAQEIGRGCKLVGRKNKEAWIGQINPYVSKRWFLCLGREARKHASRLTFMYASRSLPMPDARGGRKFSFRRTML